MIISGGAFVAFLDDGTGTGTPFAVASTVIYMIDRFKMLGLTIYIKMSSIYAASQDIIDIAVKVEGFPKDWITSRDGIQL